MDINEPGFLILSEIWYPGWKAFDNGEETKIYRANFMFRSVELLRENNNPMCDELVYLNASEVEFENQPRKKFSNSLYLTRKVFLENILDKLPGFSDINLLTDKEYGREVRVIVPNNKLKLVYETLENTKFNKLENKFSII